MYYQGIGAGPKILQNPDASFRDTLSQFGPGYANKVITANPWLADIKTNRDFINWSEQKMGKQGFTGQPQPIDMNRAAILSSVAGGGGDPQQRVKAFHTARASDTIVNAQTPEQVRIGQALMGVATPGFNTVAGTTDEAIREGAPKLRSDEAIAAGNAQVKLIGDLYGGSSTRRGDGSMLRSPSTAPKNFNEEKALYEEAQAAGFNNFAVPLDEDGAPTEDPYEGFRGTWTTSYANARKAGMDPYEARAEANVHHFGTDNPDINSEDTFRLGFGKDPRIPTIKNSEPLQISPAFGADPERTAALIGSIPELFGLPPVQSQQGNPNAGTPMTGVEQPAPPTQNTPPPMIARPERMNRLSDQFKPEETSSEKKARLGKEKEITALENQIADVVDLLKTRKTKPSYSPFMGTTASKEISSDQYELNRKRLIKLEEDLEKLKGGGVQAGQSREEKIQSILQRNQ